MLSPDIYMKLTELCYTKHIKTMSILINHIIMDYFTQMKVVSDKDKVIENLQNIITELGERAENYRTKIIKEEKDQNGR